MHISGRGRRDRMPFEVAPNLGGHELYMSVVDVPEAEATKRPYPATVHFPAA
jgi:hypothetical protein